MTPVYPTVVCDRNRFQLFSAVAEFGRKKSDWYEWRAPSGGQFLVRETADLFCGVHMTDSRRTESGPSNCEISHIRLGPLAERLLWFLHCRAVRSQQRTLVISDEELSTSLWPGIEANRPTHWRTEIGLVLGSIAKVHALELGHDGQEFGQSTSLLAVTEDLRVNATRDECPEDCPNRGAAKHHHYLVELGPGFLGRLEQCRIDPSTDRDRDYDFHNRKSLRKLGRQNHLATVFLPAKLGDRSKCSMLSPGQHRILQSLFQEVTRAAITRKNEPVRNELVTQGMIPDFHRIPAYCSLLPATQQFVIFGGNGYRKGLGYLISSKGGWCAKAGYEVDRTQDFLSDLLSLAEILHLIIVGVTRETGNWLSGEDVYRLATLQLGRAHLKRLHLRIYADSNYCSQWSEFFDWPPSDARLIDLNSLQMQFSTSGVSQKQLAESMNIHPSLLSRYLSGKRLLPEDTYQRLMAQIASEKAQRVRKKH